MQTKQKLCKTTRIILTLFCFFIMTSVASAELKIESVSPAIGELGEDLNVTLTGTDFDSDTRVSLYPDVVNEKMIISSVTFSGWGEGVTVVWNTAYVATGGPFSDGLEILDVSNPSEPEKLATVDLPSTSNEVTVIGSTAYVVCGYGSGWTGMKIIDVSDLSNPAVIGSVDTPGAANGITVIGNTAYVADDSGLHIIDVSNPSTPSVIGSVNILYATGVTVINNTAYVSYSDGLQIISVSNPSAPNVIGSVYIPSAAGVTVIGNTAYLACGNLQIIDVSNPSEPEIIGSAETGGNATGVMAVGNRVYVADKNAGLQIIDAGNPSEPDVIGSVDTPDIANGVMVTGNTAFVPCGGTDLFRGNMQIIDVSNPSGSTFIGGTGILNYANGVTVIEDTAYVAYGDAYSRNGMQIIDVSDPSEPDTIASVDTLTSANEIMIVGSTAYVACNSGLQIIDISNPSEPEIIGSADTLYNANAVTVIEDTAYVSCGGYGHSTGEWNGLQIIDVSDPSETKIKASLETIVGAWGTTIVGNTAYIACSSGKGSEWNGLQIIDVSNLSEPVVTASLDLRPWVSTRDVAVKGDVAYVVSHDSLIAVDVSDPFNPEITGSAADVLTWGRKITVTEDMAYIADMNGGLQILDISDPYNPTVIGSVDTPGYAHDVAVIGNSAYVADADRLVIVPVPIEIKPVSFNSETSISLDLPSPQIAGHYTFRVFNGQESHELPSSVSFVDSEVYQKLRQRKTTVIAGTVSVSKPTLDGETSVTIQAKNIASPGNIRVWAAILPPDYNSPLDIPITDLPTTELTDHDNDGSYEGDYNGFTQQGDYEITVYATDTKDAYSLSVQPVVTQTKGTGDPKPGEWVNISGRILSENTPLCAMILANGQSIYSCAGNGEYELEVPLDRNGEITLFAFCDGFAAFNETLNPYQADGFEVHMVPESADSPKMTLTKTVIYLNEGLVKITGKVLYNDTPICAIVIANGRYMFACAGDGEYELYVPPDENREITLSAFSDGFQSYKKILKLH